MAPDWIDQPSRDSRLSLRDSLLRDRGSAGGEGVRGPAIEDCLTPPETAEEIGRLGVYRILRQLGQGGMGRVYEAEDTRLRRRVALKILLPVHGGDDAARARFFREAEVMAALTHPHVIGIYDVGMAPARDGQRDLPYLAMQLLQGETLETSVLRRGRIPSVEAIRIARQTAEGLAAAHAKGLIHRDIKPANIWLEAPDGTVKILDFGLAREIGGGTRLSQSGLMLGTPAFMAPEQARGDAVDPRADLFSLGCVLYTILAGEVPFDGPSVMAILTRLAVYDPPPLTERLPEISPDLSALVNRLLAKDPGGRPDSALAVVEDLRRLESNLPLAPPPPGRRPPPLPTAPTPTEPQTPAPPGRRHFLAATLGGIAGCAGLASLVWWWNQRPTNATGEPCRVGILHSQSGTMSASEVPVLEMTQLALEEINARGGLLGRQVEWILGDGASNETSFAREAERLIGKEGVVAIFGCWTSASRKAVKDVVEARKHLLFYPVQYEGMEQSAHIVYTGAAPNQQLLPAADWCVRQKEKKTFLLIGSDYIFPRAANALLRYRLEEIVGKNAVLDELYVPLGSSEMRTIIEAIKRTRPEVILNTINGDSNVAFFRALRQAGTTPRETLTVSFSLDEQSLRGLEPASVAGTYTAWNYFAALPGSVNADFKRRYQRRWGAHKVVTDPMEAAWLSVSFWAQAVEQCRRPEDIDAVRRSLGGQSIDAPEGKGVRIDADTRHTWKYFRLGRITTTNEIDIVFSDDAPISPVPYPRYRTPAEWDQWQLDQYRRWGNRWSAPTEH